MRYFELFLLACLCANSHGTATPQQQRCNALNSASQYDQNFHAIQCSVGDGCFSLDCQPTSQYAVLLYDTDFHIFIEPCKHPVAILVNASVLGAPYSHEFTHTETVDLPTVGPISPKLKVVINNDDSQVLVFSVVLIVNANTSYTLVPQTNFPLNNISCSNGHLVTHPHTHTSHTHTQTPIPTFYCGETCEAVHRLVASTNSLCNPTDESCLIIKCNPPDNPLVKFSTSYTILPCEQPPVVQVRFYEQNNDLHYVRNITHNTTIPVPNLPGVQLQITLVDLNQYSILFGVNLLVLEQSISILPNQVIPIDRTNCSWYTGPPCTATTAPMSIYTNTSTNTNAKTNTNTNTKTNIYTNTSTNTNTNTNTNTYTNTNSPYSHPFHTTPSATAHANTSSDTRAEKGSLGSNIGTIAGIVIGTVFLTLLVVVISVAATLCVVYVFYKKKAKGEYNYIQFRPLGEDDY